MMAAAPAFCNASELSSAQVKGLDDATIGFFKSSPMY
jgi:hypothetical protein